MKTSFRRTVPLLVALACTGGIAAGCGDDDEKKSDAPAAASTTPADSGSTTSGTTGTTSGGPAADAAKEQAIEACKSSINAVPTLSADVKKDLEGTCEDAANGDAAAVQEATKEVCIKIAEASVPAGAARDTAVKGCEQATAN